jgi:hypothetical protein
MFCRFHPVEYVYYEFGIMVCAGHEARGSAA